MSLRPFTPVFHIVQGGKPPQSPRNRQTNSERGLVIARRFDAQDGRIICSDQGQSRFDRRRANAPVCCTEPPRNLGVIEGERLQRSRGYRDEASLAKNLASLVAVALVLVFFWAVIAGAL
ncbi:hypothetical protein FJ872_19590 [Mesorhizobium sp. B2-5-9]|uniref:hypothetical protein n=1 Tax=Mesorhizobium sp. B2-5-9 TaxID=2589921 RepID=UPI00112A11B9|nr:hypothetical protein [Mesorhizobium sp. B2-5-9]TPK15200.1 hypothetical protein FJ872_19590 [Mesorhizobium sp. B2-5-9]